MIYLLYGTDTKKARQKLHSLLDSMFAKKPNASFIRIDDENFDTNQLTELISGQGLFESKYIIVFDNVFENNSAKEAALKNIKNISASQNIFIFIEDELNKKELLKFEKYAEKIQRFENDGGRTSVKKERFDIFSLTDALGRRDAKHLWILYQRAKINNVSDEEVHGILFWQVKSMLIAESANSAEDAKLNPFVFRKSSEFLKNYKSDELKKLSSALVSLYHDSRRGMHELGAALERFILGIQV